jgi:AcrR family transcriptional regulator
VNVEIQDLTPRLPGGAGVDSAQRILLNNWSVKLTNQLVRSAARGKGPRRGRRPAAEDSRERICAAAAQEFAARGFAGTSVDRIAAAARLNKAMIYYHFRSKAALYREILRDMFNAVAARMSEAAAADAPAPAKIRQFIEGFAAEAEARPHFPAIWFREIAEGGAHLDDVTLSDMAGIVKSLASIIEAGTRAGEFKPISPLLVHAGIVAPVLLFFASAGLRKRISHAGLRGASSIGRDEMVAHIQRVTLGLLEGRM